MDQWEVVSSTGHGSPYYHTHYSGTDQLLAGRAFRLAIEQMADNIARGMVEGQALVTQLCNDDIVRQKEWR